MPAPLQPTADATATFTALANQQADLLKNLNAVLARNLSTEFSAREGNVGSEKNTRVFTKVQNRFLATAGKAALVAVSDIYNFETSVSFDALDSINLAYLIKVEFSNDLNQTGDANFRPTAGEVDYIFPEVRPWLAANTADKAVYSYRARYRTRYRALRLTLVNFGNSGAVVPTSANFDGLWTALSPMSVTFYGE